MPVIPIAFASAVVRVRLAAVRRDRRRARGRWESTAFSIAALASATSSARPGCDGTSSMPPETTLNVASRGGTVHGGLEGRRASSAPRATDRDACRTVLRKLEELGDAPARRAGSASARRSASTGAESAVLAACDAAASCSPVTFCSARTTGSRDRPVALERGQRARRSPSRHARDRGPAPDRSGDDDAPTARAAARPASTAGRSTAAAIRATVYRSDGRVDVAPAGRPPTPKIRVCTRFRPRTGANPSPAAAADRDGRSPVGPHAELRCAERERAPSGDELDRRPPERRRSDARASASPRRRRARRRRRRRPSSRPARRLGDPAKQDARRGSRTAPRRPTARTARRAAIAVGASAARHSRDDWSRRKTRPRNVAERHAPALTRKGD